MRGKRLLLFAALVLAAGIGVFAGCGGIDVKEEDTSTEQQSNGEQQTYYFKTEGKYFAVYDGDSYEQLYLNGVNIGAGKPGYFPGELAITKAEYLSWFEQIAAMNCNTIRVYTVMMPCFYEALYEYNETAEQKLYLFQGVWYDEDQIAETEDAYDIYEEALEDAYDLVDVIHGNADISEKTGKAYGKYRYDVSEYVIGWILGIESDAEFVGGTNEKHANECSYEGTYLYTTDDANPYEKFMCELGDKTLTYEMKTYGMQRPVSWSNWPTADVMTHENEPMAKKEDAVTINVEHIKATDAFEAGVFASYHIYPYYPEFMMCEEEYASYVDEDGKANTYKAYLEDLISYHTVPVLVAEFGVPASRGCTHVNTVTGYNQGNLSEEEQGEMLVSMAEDIYESGYCGGLVFTWQDEWFKRTWNTMDYTDSERRAYWSDVQTSEQNFGLLAFDPGRSQMTVNVDGDLSDWDDDDILTDNGEVSVSVKQDARYLYILVQGDNLAPETERVVVPLGITPQSGSYTYEGYTFSDAVDFVIDLQGKENSAVYVQSYYDRYLASYGTMDENADLTGYDDAASDVFNPIYLCLNRTMVYPKSGETVEFQKYETGKLRYGNGNPESDDYDSLADFCYGDNAVEIRIPWSLLNFRDPSTKEIENDFHVSGEFSGLLIENITIGVATESGSAVMEEYTWEDWDQTIYHERLKQSYYSLQECFAALGKEVENETID